MTYLRHFEVFLPERRVYNEDLVRLNPSWSAEKIYSKTGIRCRRFADAAETATDLGYKAAASLFRRPGIDPRSIDAVLFCTESPDYFLPPSACILHNKLGLRSNCGAFDYNLGCSGFTYGLWLCKALVASGQADNVLLILADTYSKYCDPHDLATSTIFGDGAAAAVIGSKSDNALAKVGQTVVGTDGQGAEHLIVRNGAARYPKSDDLERDTTQRFSGDKHGGSCLFMNGPAVYAFTLKAVRATIQEMLDKTQLRWEDIDMFLLHQANRYMLDQLRKSMQIPQDRLPVFLEDVGNTVSASIPILMQECMRRRLLTEGGRYALVGFGVGFSWATTLIEWLAMDA